MPNMPTRETITAQHPNHYSIQESVACEKCNPYGLTDKQYRKVLDDGGDPSEQENGVSVKVRTIYGNYTVNTVDGELEDMLNPANWRIS